MRWHASARTQVVGSKQCAARCACATLRPSGGCNGRSRKEYDEPGSFGICSEYWVTDPVDPDLTCAFFDRLIGVGAMLHAGADEPMARRDLGAACSLDDTPAAAGGDREEPGYRVLHLLHKPQGDAYSGAYSHARRVGR